LHLRYVEDEAFHEIMESTVLRIGSQRQEQHTHSLLLQFSLRGAASRCVSQYGKEIQQNLSSGIMDDDATVAISSLRSAAYVLECEGDSAL
tara:strand:+ start:713 stop:985 length:273 start_codon:yes stop_codon:yes gene_type:complete